jgi:AsmA protein
MDAHLGLRVKSLILPQLQTGKISLSSQLQHGKLSVQLKEAELYNGTLVGALHLDSGQLPPAVSTRITITDIQTKDIPGFSYLEGKVTAEGEVKSVGANMQQWLNNLEGTLFLKISEAVLKGGDVLAMISNVSGSFDPDKRKNSNTQITEVTGTFQIERGVMRGDDLHIRTPLLGIFGKGSINLAEQTIDYRLDPEPISLNSEAGEIGVRIPLIVRGPLNSPVIVPDIERTLKDLIRNTAPLEKQLEKHLGREIKLNIKELRLDQKTTDQLKDGIQKQLGKELNKLLDGSQ